MTATKRKRGRPPLSKEEKHRRAVQRARKRTQKALTAHLTKDQQALWEDLALVGDFDLSVVWRMTMLELVQMQDEYAEAVRLGLNDPATYRRRKAEYLELARKLSLAAKDLQTEPLTEITINIEGLTAGGIWVDEDGSFIPPPSDTSGEPH